MIIHNHVFKNAGTTIDWALRRQFGDGFVDHRDDQEMVRGAAYLGPWLAERPEVVALSTHHLRPPLPQLPDTRLLTLMMLRHPIERVTSVYRFERAQMQATTLGAVYARDHDLADYVRWRLRDDVPPTIRNFHVHRTLSGPVDWRLPAGEAELREACRYLEGIEMLGLVDRFDESMVLFEEALRPCFPDIDLAYTMQNVGQPREDRSVRLARLRAEIGEETFHRLVDANQPDLALYDHALVQFEQRVMRVPAFDERLAGFRARCAALSAPPVVHAQAATPASVTTEAALPSYADQDLDEATLAEVQKLASLALKYRFAPPAVQAALQRRGFQIERAHFYSPIPTIEDIAQAFEYAQDAPFDVDGIFDLARLRDNLAVLTPHAAAFAPPTDGDTEQPAGYFWKNGMFSYSDAMSYYAMVRRLRPRTIVEIGSGFSTLVASEAVQANGQGRIVCVEPFPRPWLADVPHVELVQQRAQALTRQQLDGWLSDGDILFIDSTHTVKIGSDCLHLYLRLLPAIRSSVHVHVHDVFLPEGMPRAWALEHHIYWTEQYLLLAYLTCNPRCRMVFGSHHGHLRLPHEMKALMHGRWPQGGCSFWFHQAAPGQVGDGCL